MFASTKIKDPIICIIYLVLEGLKDRSRAIDFFIICLEFLSLFLNKKNHSISLDKKNIVNESISYALNSLID
jgi:hypothetical protein